MSPTRTGLLVNRATLAGKMVMCVQWSMCSVVVNTCWFNVGVNEWASYECDAE